MPSVLTTGDSYNIKCPNCDHTINYICYGVKIEYPKAIEFKTTCPSCKVYLRATAQYEIKVQLERY